MIIRNHTDLSKLETFLGRFKYLSLNGRVGETTFGTDRWINQAFYTSPEWRRVRRDVIVRDEGCDLGIPGHDIHDKIIIHHMNPMSVDDIVEGDPSILDPEFLICVTQNTHNAIHYGDETLLPRWLEPRKPGDTVLWRRR